MSNSTRYDVAASVIINSANGDVSYAEKMPPIAEYLIEVVEATIRQTITIMEENERSEDPNPFTEHLCFEKIQIPLPVKVPQTVSEFKRWHIAHAEKVRALKELRES